MARGKDARGAGVNDMRGGKTPATAGVVDLAMGMSALKGRQNTARGKRSEPREATPGRRRIEPATVGVVDLARVEETSASGRCDKYGDAPINLSSPEFSKHVAHIGDVRRIPIIERLIETLCTIKHLAHIDDVRCIPFVERLIETLCTRKHPAHIGDV